MVYDFKLGNYQTAAVLLVDFLRGRYSRSELECFTLCVIPASTMEKNERRYRRFCEYVSAKTGIQNGMDAISILYDRANSKEGKSENTILNLAFSESVMGADVLLFDDIMTRGTSFTQCAGRLMERGANSVTGFSAWMAVVWDIQRTGPLPFVLSIGIMPWKKTMSERSGKIMLTCPVF